MSEFTEYSDEEFISFASQSRWEFLERLREEAQGEIGRGKGKPEDFSISFVPQVEVDHVLVQEPIRSTTRVAEEGPKGSEEEKKAKGKIVFSSGTIPSPYEQAARPGEDK